MLVIVEDLNRVMIMDKIVKYYRNKHKLFIKLPVKSVYSTQKGLTLVEIIISLALLGIITIPILNMFVHSTSTNSKAQNIIEGTYIAQSTMENIYDLSKSYSFSEGLIQLTSTGYVEATINPEYDYSYTKEMDNHYIKIELSNLVYNDSLVKVIVKIYNDGTMNKLESQIETILSWEK